MNSNEQNAFCMMIERGEINNKKWEDNEEYRKLDKKYRDCSIHVALERADDDKNWIVFKTILKLDTLNLMKHIFMTKQVFTWNYMRLPQREINYLFDFVNPV
jgi:hypothetical protein